MTRSADLLQAADPAGALKALSDEVRAKPGDAKLRVFMAQLLCVLGQWERALNQLNVAAELDAGPEQPAPHRDPEPKHPPAPARNPPGGVTRFSAVSAIDQPGIVRSSRPSSKSRHTMNSG